MASLKRSSDQPMQSKRKYLSQQDVPAYSLEEALRVPQAIYENYGGQPTAPLKVAKAMDLQPNSSRFRMLTGAAIAYGLTEGAAKSLEIALTPLGNRILRPLEEGDDLVAKREALLRPRVIGEFLRRYSGSPLPRPDIAYNVLEDMGVPRDRTKDVLELIVSSAQALGFIEDIKGKQYVDLSGASRNEEPQETSRELQDSGELNPGQVAAAERSITENASSPPKHSGSIPLDLERRRRVFITHGKNKTFIEPVKKLLAFGELEAVVATETETVSKPVPDKVLDSMRSCGAAIIHIDAETKLLDTEAREQIVLNPNVLIEVGAAMALYGRRFILLVKDGITLPSNLQGLYEVRFTGDTLDGNATIKLLEAINDIKRQPLPN